MENINHHDYQIELTFIKRSASQFAFEIAKIHQILDSKDFQYDIMLELMAQLVAIKENIELLENKF